MTEKDLASKAMAERTTILRADIGSKGFGLSLPTSDDDHMGVCIEDFDVHTTLGAKFEQYVEKGNEGGALDLTIYSLEKFLRLAAQGNPTVVSILFTKAPLKIDSRGSQLQELLPALISRHWGKRFLGYMESQRQKLIGERGQKRVNRVELEQKYGFDTKYAMHLLRLGYQGVQVMTSGRMDVPFEGELQAFLMGVRVGKVSLNEVLQEAGELERALKDLLTESSLPETPNYDYVNEWMRNMYWENWKARQITTLFTGTRRSIDGDDPESIH